MYWIYPIARDVKCNLKLIDPAGDIGSCLSSWDAQVGL